MSSEGSRGPGWAWRLAAPAHALLDESFSRRSHMATVQRLQAACEDSGNRVSGVSRHPPRATLTEATVPTVTATQGHSGGGRAHSGPGCGTPRGPSQEQREKEPCFPPWLRARSALLLRLLSWFVWDGQPGIAGTRLLMNTQLRGEVGPVMAPADPLGK